MENIEINIEDIEKYEFEDATWYEDDSFFEFFQIRNNRLIKRFFIKKVSLTTAVELAIIKDATLTIQPEYQNNCLEIDGFDIII